MKKLDLAPYRFDNGKFHSCTWPGGYPLFYLCEDSGVLCPNCMNENAHLVLDADAEPDWKVVAVDANWEDPELYCDNCNERIESAYAEPEE